MAEYTLVIGNKNYSSWSLRAWLMMKAAGVPFREILIPLEQENPTSRAIRKNEILRYSPSGLVPVLMADDTLVWESLAIGEYLADTFPEANLWPREPVMRAHARSISSEMHAGFTALRSQCAMNMKKCEIVEPSAETSLDITRIERLWADARAMVKGGDFLYGHFTIADAMYAPVISRFISYGIKVSDDSRRYIGTIMNYPAFLEWQESALQEKWVL